MSVRVDGVLSFHGPVSAAYMDVQPSVDVPAGAHKVTVALTNDLRTRWCDRNLFVDSVALTNVSVLPTWPDPAERATTE
jgi:hypothetical protein